MSGSGSAPVYLVLFTHSKVFGWMQSNPGQTARH